MTKCWACGQENQAGEQFCEACGIKLEAGGAEAQPVDQPELEEPDQPELEEPDQPELEEPDQPQLEEPDQPQLEEPEPEPAPTPKAGYLVFPDKTEKQIAPSQWLIGRADLVKYVSDPERTNEISRGHLTVFQEGEKFFIEDGKTMVQDRPSTNKTWLIRDGSRRLVTGNGRSELQDADEIDIAELVKLQFAAK